MSHKNAYVPRGPHEHAFDPLSGWCAHCLTRDDGLALAYDGHTIRRPAHQSTPPAPNELDW